jgi:hypothetical protein
MRLRSTGLGKTELEGKIVDVRRIEDIVVFYMDVIKPVKWRTRMAFQESDLRSLVFAVLKPKNVRYIVKSFFSDQEKVPRTETF